MVSCSESITNYEFRSASIASFAFALLNSWQK